MAKGSMLKGEVWTKSHPCTKIAHKANKNYCNLILKLQSYSKTVQVRELVTKSFTEFSIIRDKFILHHINLNIYPIILQIFQNYFLFWIWKYEIQKLQIKISFQFINSNSKYKKYIKKNQEHILKCILEKNSKTLKCVSKIYFEKKCFESIFYLHSLLFKGYFHHFVEIFSLFHNSIFMILQVYFFFFILVPV